MKKLICAMMLLLSAAVLCSCTAERAAVFDSKSIDNGYNNYLAGGNMAYKDNNLYVNFISDGYKALGTYKFNNDGVSQVLSGESVIGSYAFEVPEFYQLGNKIYAIDDRVYIYDEAEDKLTESEYGGIYDYISEDLSVVKDGNELTVKYKDKPGYTIENVYDFYVAGNIIYSVNYDGWLYRNDVTEGNSKSTFMNYLTESYTRFLHVCGDNVYFYLDAANYDEHETGLYCYSIAEDSYKLILKGEVNCLNSFGDVLYIAAKNGIYRYNAGEPEKITSRGAKEIYLLDEDWIYAVQNDAGNVYRVSLDGEKMEMIDFVAGNQG